MDVLFRTMEVHFGLVTLDKGLESDLRFSHIDSLSSNS